MRQLLVISLVLLTGANAFALECDGIPEGEPPLVDGYIDFFNSGCGAPEPSDYFQHLEGNAEGNLVFCARGGWFLDSSGFDSWDTDWFSAVIGPSGVLQWTLEAEQLTFGFLLGPNDCSNVGALQTMSAGPWAPGSMDIVGTPGSLVWLWTGPVDIVAPPGFEGNEYTYICTFTGLGQKVVDTEGRTFGGIKSIYR